MLQCEHRSSVHEQAGPVLPQRPVLRFTGRERGGGELPERVRPLLHGDRAHAGERPVGEGGQVHSGGAGGDNPRGCGRKSRIRGVVPGGDRERAYSGQSQQRRPAHTQTADCLGGCIHGADWQVLFLEWQQGLIEDVDPLAGDDSKRHNLAHPASMANARRPGERTAPTPRGRRRGDAGCRSSGCRRSTRRACAARC